MSLRLLTSLIAVGLSSCATSSTETQASAQPPSEEVAKLETKTLNFEVEIAAPVEAVWETMLDQEAYRQWTAPFSAGSYFEGSWAEGERMRFLGPGENGMVAEIAVNRPHEVLSIRHLGFILEGVEDTTSKEVRSWAPAYETYRFAPTSGGTMLSIEQDVIAVYEEFMNQIWPKALAELKTLCEEGSAE